MIVVNKENLEPQCPDIENRILLYSRYLHHLIRSQNDVENFVANDDIDTLGLGSICLGNGVYILQTLVMVMRFPSGEC